jgi:hypothetical protein
MESNGIEPVTELKNVVFNSGFEQEKDRIRKLNPINKECFMYKAKQLLDCKSTDIPIDL